MATLMGLEPTTSAVTGRRSNQLSYSATRRRLRTKIWARLGLNQRPPACEADALPLSYAPLSRLPAGPTGSLTLDKPRVYPITRMLSSHRGRNDQPMLEGFPSVSHFAVPFSDCDMLQHVNNVAYIRWCETMRTNFFADVLHGDITGAQGIIQANISFIYERQIEYRERIAIGVRVSRIGNKSFDFAYEIWSETHRHRAAHGTTTVVAYDFVNRRTIEVPSEWRSLIAQAQPSAATII